MNHLLNNISWSIFFTAAALIAIVYYTYVAWKYYRGDIRQLIDRISGKQNDQHQLPAALRYEEPEEVVAYVPQPVQEPYEQIADKNEGITYELGQELSACIEAHSDKPYNPALLIPQLKKILNDYPELAATPDREKINALVVRECERTGTALLTEGEVDMWWSA
ncbi:hypothetical protein [Mucilaginibacter defluvii]|uniref:Uncharacterized protein n=1 Tax=Mucilaginibacter defluvii TaxID=1196019 RepID=A0ABP9FN33_9SPHI|nr:hypothetical protein [Bacteroidota bacterium]